MASSGPGPTTPTALKAIVRQGLEALCNAPRDPQLFRSLLAPRIHAQHDGSAPITDPDAFVAGFAKTLQFLPDFHMEILELVAEVDASGRGGKVWSYSRVTGKGGAHRVASVDMVTVDAEGKIVATLDVQRKLAAEEE